MLVSPRSARADLVGVHADGAAGQLLVHGVQLLHERAVPALLGLGRRGRPHGNHFGADVSDERRRLLQLIKKALALKVLFRIHFQGRNEALFLFVWRDRSETTHRNKWILHITLRLVFRKYK